MVRGAKVTVAGAGALGLCSALALAEAGCEVTVSDPAREGRASAVAAGMLAPVFEAVLDPAAASHFDVLLAARDLWPGLEARAGVRLDRAGAMAVGDDAWMARVGAGLIRLGLHGIDLPRATAEALAPGLSPEFGRGLLVREDWRLEPGAALATLRRAAEQSGIAFVQARVSQPGNADWLVIATGADPGLTELAPELTALSPIKGQIARYKRGPAPAVSVRGEGAYVVAAADGVAVGATMEAGHADTDPDMEAARPLIAAGARLLPELADQTPLLAVGVRAATPDGLPLVGFSQAPKVILATGARRNGWLLAPLVARLVCACVTGQDTGPYARRFDPARVR